MNRIGMLLLLSLLFITGCVPEVESAKLEPPAVTLTVDGQNIPYLRGGYSWAYKGKAVVADSLLPPQLVKSTAAFGVKPQSKLFIHFDDQPKSLTAELWKDDTNTSIPLIENVISLPKESGIYVYSIHAEWNEGRVVYACKIQIQAAGEAGASS